MMIAFALSHFMHQYQENIKEAKETCVFSSLCSCRGKSAKSLSSTAFFFLFCCCCLWDFLKLNVAAVAFHVCSLSKLTIAGGMAKWLASLPIIKSEHSLTKWGAVSFPVSIDLWIHTHQKVWLCSCFSHFPWASCDCYCVLDLASGSNWDFFIFDTECEFKKKKEKKGRKKLGYDVCRSCGLRWLSSLVCTRGFPFHPDLCLLTPQ